MSAWGKSKYKELGACYKDYRKEYQVWNNMKERCMNPKNEMFRFYGKRGIKVCDRWLGEDGFLNFYRDMAMVEDADSAVIGILRRKGYVLTIPERII